MTEVLEITKGKTRDLPISNELKVLLKATAQAVAIDKVVVTSGGQCAKGKCTKRTGSTRHDNGQAADLQLQAGGRTLDFTVAGDLPAMIRFVTEAARRGATGVGAGMEYMGSKTLHIGFGTRAVWGAGGQSSKAPEWIRKAALAGWNSGQITMPRSTKSTDMAFSAFDEGMELDSDDSEQETDYEYEAGV